ncbi:hypothetical protein WOLCODRAFT_168067 [Wolfiporia cocos MD-104 SS10]|uniref:Uncharacterized protein n=1 Tax=Wolfiporia cocos (strain MD-104) TaxID=742152 RepID=A0A2H3JCR5_WOLCO|nr:hypothetical protein WOLCODRAFT_168067 [Wolfiporia cocos MD-104 SS10]
MSDQLQLWYLNYIPHASNNPSKVNVDRGGQIADLAKAIAIELQLPEAESSFIEIWKPKEELVIEEDEGERRSAGKSCWTDLAIILATSTPSQLKSHQMSA